MSLNILLLCPCCGLISNLITSSIIITLIHTFENENEHGFKHSKYKYHPIMYFFLWLKVAKILVDQASCLPVSQISMDLY